MNYVLVQDTDAGPVDVMSCGADAPQYQPRPKLWLTNPGAPVDERVYLTDGGDDSGQPVLRVEQRSE